MYNIVLVTEVWLFWDVKHDYNKCIGDDTKAAARQSLNCINTKKIKYGEKRFSIWRMEFLHPAMWHDDDIDFARWLHPAIWHVALESWQWTHQVAAPCRPAMWYVALRWHAIEFAQTSAILEFYIWFRFRPDHRSRRHSAPVSEILSKSDHPRQKKITSCRFSRWRISAILDFREPIKKPNYTTLYRSSIDTVALHCLVFEKIAFFLHFGDRQTNRQTNRQTDGQHRSTKPLSLSRAAA